MIGNVQICRWQQIRGLIALNGNDKNAWCKSYSNGFQNALASAHCRSAPCDCRGILHRTILPSPCIKYDKDIRPITTMK